MIIINFYLYELLEDYLIYGVIGLSKFCDFWNFYK